MRNGYHDHEYDGVAELAPKQIYRGKRNKLQMAAAAGNNSLDALVIESRPRELLKSEYESYMPSLANTAYKYDTTLESASGEFS